MSDYPHLDLPHYDDARVEAILRTMVDHDLTLDTPPGSVWHLIETDTAPVIDLATRRRLLRPGLMIGAIAAALALIVGIGVVAPRGGDRFQEFASAELAYAAGPGFDVGGAGHSASTTYLIDDDRARVRFDAADLPAPGEGEDVEVWLIGLDEAGEIEIIQTLGVIDDLTDPGTFDVPDGFSADDYATVAVDLSFEPRDGVETHSGRSVLRGPLSI